MVSMSLRAPTGRAGAAAALVAAVAATASLCYAIRRYRRAVARALSASPSVECSQPPPRSQSPRFDQTPVCSRVEDAQPLQAIQQQCVSSDLFPDGQQPTPLPRTSLQCALAVRSNPPHQPFVKPGTTCSRPFSWMVFWDLENIRVPSSTSPAAFVQALCKALRAVAPYSCVSRPQPVLRILAVANIHTTPLQQRKSLQSNGVSIVHFETDGRKDACDKALITELCLLPHEHAPPMGVALLSGDVDFAYALARLTALGYYTVVIAPNMRAFSRQLASVPKTILTFDQIFAHISPLIVPQSQQNPNVKATTAQQGADQKQRAPRNARKRQQKHKPPKRAPVVSDANVSTEMTNAERNGTNDTNVVSPAVRSHSANATQSPDSNVVSQTFGATGFWYPLCIVPLLSILCTMALLFWFARDYSH